MILGYEESKDVHGRFYEFLYKTIVKRNQKSEHFGCFKGNNLQVFELTTSIFCHDVNSFLHIVNGWNDPFGVYTYVPIGEVSPIRSYIPYEVVELMYRRNNFKYLLHYNDLHEYIK